MTYQAEKMDGMDLSGEKDRLFEELVSAQEDKKRFLIDYFDWHKSMGFVSHKKEDIEEFCKVKFGGKK